MIALTYTLTTLQPVIVNQPGVGEENSSVSLDYIPGTTIRGALASLYLQQRKNILNPETDPQFRRIFLVGSTRFLNIYPARNTRKRMLPQPLSWRIPKDDLDENQATISDFAVQYDPNIDQPKLPKELFCTTSSNHDVVSHSPEHILTAHNAGTVRMIKRKNDSVVYHYDALSANQIFAGVILSENISDLQLLENDIRRHKNFLIGGARSAGYGRVEISNTKITQNWTEYTADSPLDDKVFITLLSPGIFIDSNGYFASNPDEYIGAQHIDAYFQTTMTGAFNRKWGLPSMQALAVHSGSVFVYSKNDIDLNRLAHLKETGIGEQQSVGFGRIAVNWFTRSTLERTFLSAKNKIGNYQQLRSEISPMAEMIGNRLLRVAIEKRMLTELSVLEMKNPISHSQISRLRQVILRAWRRNDADFVISHLDNLTSASADSFRRARIGRVRFIDWIRNAFEKNDFWNDFLEPQKSITFIGNSVTPDADIRLEYTVRFIDAFLQKVLKTSVD